ncbi:MAG: S8 family serine peptidase [Bacteroidetes bacterium]|jgi:hypothetical protein|nr:S8 family serine peptidase [Bacteroidota bacterium]
MNISFSFLLCFLSVWVFGFSQAVEAQREANRIPTELILQLPFDQKPSIDSRQYEVLSPSLNVYRLQFSEVVEATRFYNRNINKESNLALHFNYQIEFRDTVPNDPDFDLQYALENTLNPDIDVQARDAWNFTRGGVNALGDTIVLAIVDDGVDIDHTDLSGNIFSFRNEIAGTGIDNNGNGFIDDVNGYNVRDDNGAIISAQHGTGVAGIIGARGNNGILISGVNWNTKLLPVTMGPEATVAEVIKSYEYVLQQRRLYNETGGDQGAYIVAINNSFGLEGFTYESAPYWCDFFDTLGQEGIMTIAAAPNRIFDVDEIGDLPTVCPSPYLITVGASNFANAWDASGISTEHVDLTSYGGNLLTLGQNNSTTFSQNSTSSAAAMVTGLLGLMYAVPCSVFVDSIQNDFSLVHQFVRPVLVEALISKPFLANKTNTGGITNFYETLRPLVQRCDSCTAPEEVNIDFINSQEDSILIAPTLLSDSLVWLQRIAGNTVWDTVSVPSTDSLYLEMGPGCANLEYAFIPVCDSLFGTRSSIFSTGSLKDCMACEISYCTPSEYTMKNSWIESISFEDDVAYSSNDLGYGNYTGQIFTTYETAKDQRLNVSFRKRSASDTLSFAVWLDIDHSGSFDPLEKIGTLVTSNATTAELALNIPFTALGGLTTMRLGMIPNSSAVDRLMPCDAAPLEAYYEDYCINLIVNDPMCAPIDSINIVEKTPNLLKIAYFPELAPTDEGINVRYRVEGEEEWTRMTHQGASFRMEDLEGPCVTYELDIRRICEFDTSEYTTFLVETDCPTSSQEEVLSSFKVFPNPYHKSIYIQAGSPHSVPYDIRMYDQKGRLVAEISQVESPDVFRVPKLPDLAPGLYYLHIVDQNRSYHYKVIKIE